MAFPALCASVDNRCRERECGVSLGHDVTEDALNTQVPKQELLAELTAEHRRLDDLLKELEKRRALTPTERDEISRLKKQKLLTKDRIARLS